MRPGLIILAASLVAASGADAQTSTTGVASSSSSKSMGELVSEGYEIKSAVPNGSTFIVFLQKDNSAYACEFATVASSRCGAIN
ncbi:hypothetical protein ACQQ2Q_00425 [Agrobacterium sp. ES01]|uniref:hypothetical protein n=1 Tax=Agrobacterium sp. ES01 TaxID=3420714 RepID=UPI003D0ADF85